MEGQFLSGGPAGCRDVEELRGAAADRRDQQHFLPNASTRAAGRLEQQGGGRRTVRVRVESAEEHYPHRALEGCCRRNRPFPESRGDARLAPRPDSVPAATVLPQG